jgi:hypothetical protein
MHPFIYLVISFIDCHFNVLYCTFLQETFDPIIQVSTGRDLIPAMVYGYGLVSASFISVRQIKIVEIIYFCFQEECKGSRLHRNVLCCVNCEVSFCLRLCLAEN